MSDFSKRPEPFRIEPIFSPRIWGARSLAPLFPEKSNLAEPLGEAWLTGLDCKIASGAFAGKSLGEAWREMPPEWRGSRLAAFGDFPLLVKFIFPTDKLSVQVHPNDAYAAKHEKAAGGRGKTEMWHAVSAEPGAEVLAGLKPGVDEKSFREGFESHALENLFQRWQVQAGDTFFIPAGTPHTIGPGMVLCEVQQYSDLTYRVYDYGRVDAHGKPRELHIGKALDVIEFGRPAGGYGKTTRLPLPAQGLQKSLLVACSYFAAEIWEDFSRVEACSSPGQFELIVILTGSGDLVWGSSSGKYQSGACWLIPANLGKFELSATEPTKLLRTYVPDLPLLRVGLKSTVQSRHDLAETIFD